MKFRKKPVVIEAWQFQPGLSGYPRGKRIVFRDQFCYAPCHPGVHAIIPTLEGEMVACPGDWLITGVKGEVYPCKPDIFAATYDPVEAAPEQAAGEETLEHEYVQRWPLPGETVRGGCDARLATGRCGASRLKHRPVPPAAKGEP